MVINCFGSCAMQRIKLRGQREHSPDVKLAVAPERAVAGDAASTRENHALTLGSRAFGSVEDSRTSLGRRHFGSGPDGRTRSFESEVFEFSERVCCN